MFSEELITEENPYGLLPTEQTPERLPQLPTDASKEDPYYPDPYA